jgi:ribonuclease BN (tRNA processing enzyme)
MKIIFLGTGEAYSEKRANVSILVESKNNILLDCGFTCPQSLWRYNKDKDFIDYVFISHFHGDHIVGLPLVCMKWRQDKRLKPLTIIGPEGLENYFRDLYEMLYKGFYKKSTFPIKFIEVQPSQEIEIGCFKLKFAAGKHLTGDTEVPVIAVKIASENKCVCYSGDTIYRQEVEDLAKDCNILIHESYMSADSGYHAMMSHCSPRDAGRLASRANVKKLALVHLQRDYAEKTEEIISEASQEFKEEIIIPNDGDEIIL